MGTLKTDIRNEKKRRCLYIQQKKLNGIQRPCKLKTDVLC